MSISLDGLLSKMLKLNKRMLSSLDLFPFFFTASASVPDLDPT